MFFSRMNFRYTFVYCFLTCCLVAGEAPIYGLQGKAVEFKTKIQTQPDEILWKHNGNKVLEFNGNEETPYGSFKDRVTLDWLSADLNIEGLTYEDSGDYELEVFTKKILERKSYKLQVIDEVGKPTITCKMNKDNSSDGSGKSATLMCSAESRQLQSLMTFEWSSNGNKHHGQNLMIPLGDGHGGEEHTCTVSNPLTRASTVFNAEECYPVKDTPTALIVIICLICLLILILVLVALWFLWGKGYLSTKGKADMEKQTTHDDGANREKKPLIKSESENTTEGKDEEIRTSSPTDVSAAPPPDPDLSVNYQKLADEDKHKEATEKESEKEEDGLPGKDKDSKTSSPPPVASRSPDVVDPALNDQKPAEDKLKEATEKEDSESDSSDSEKKNDTLPNDGANREKKPLIDRAPTMPSHQKLGHLNPPNKEDDHSESENTTEKHDIKPQKGTVKRRVSKWEQQQQHTRGKDEEGRTSSPTDVSVAPPPDPDLSVNDQKLADEDKHKEATEKESEKEEDGLPGKDKDSKTSSPPPVASRSPDVVDPALNDQKPADEDKLKEATEKEDSESDSSDSEKKNDTLPNDGANREKKPLIDRAPTMPSHQKLGHLNPPNKEDDHSESENTTEKHDIKPQKGTVKRRVSKWEQQQQHTRGKDEEGRTSSPTDVSVAPPPDPDLSVNDQKLADEDKHKEATEKESEKEEDGLPGKDKDSKTSSPPPVASRSPDVVDPALNDQKPADEDKLKEATEKEDSESDSSDSEKKNDTLPSLIPPPVVDSPVKDPEPVDEDKLKETTEKEDYDDDSSNSKNAEDVSPGKDKDSKISCPPPVAPKPHRALDLSVKDPEPDNEDKLKEATEKEHSEGGSSDSKKADDASPGKDKDSKISCPPPVAPKPHRALDLSVKDPEPDDEDQLKETTETEDSKDDFSDSKKADDASPGKDEHSKVSLSPPVSPKPCPVLDYPAINQEPADKDKLKMTMEKKVSEIASSDSEKKDDPLSESDKEKEEATLASESDVSPPATQPRSTSTQNTPNMAPKDDADKHTEDTRSDVVAEVDPEKSGT